MSKVMHNNWAAPGNGRSVSSVDHVDLATVAGDQPGGDRPGSLHGLDRHRASLADRIPPRVVMSFRFWQPARISAWLVSHSSVSV